ncbi:hypothetical protein [Rosettibacter firmus]|uniref:hyaluronate lyase N-terminal domain-containing protein n=1 Tax=Rosettibacter firmus TaxID=3111522 RepID=UPI00336BFA92
MPQIIKIKRGLQANLPTTGLNVGEPLFTTDRGTLHIATDATTLKTVVPAIETLNTIPSISGAEDLLIIHDASETTGQKEKKITFNDFKSALNIPPTSTDEKVAVVNGGTAGYIWGTDGTDGVIRMGSSMQWAKDVSNNYVTIDVAVIDGGTF